MERRDFTMNGLVADIRLGEVRDRVGGLRDLDDRVLRTIGSAQQRFTEDRLRILRALRFAATHSLTIADDTWQAINDADVVDVSRERVWQEWRKVFSPTYSGEVWARWRMLNDLTGQQRALHPELYPLNEKDQCMLIQASHQDCAWLLTWSQLASVSWLENEPVSKAERSAWKWLYLQLNQPLSDEHLVYQVEHPSAPAWFDYLRCSKSDPDCIDRWQQAHRRAQQSHWFRAQDLLALGFRPGPQFGRLLKTLRHGQVMARWSDREQAAVWLSRQALDQESR